jgi:energy-coupling factor transporter ATP-binding protein EcfA2
MLTKLTVRNLKRFDEVEIELGNPVVFIGPNDSGKTTALQAITLWHVGLRRWIEKRADKKTPEKRPGVTINRRDLIAVPIPDANLLWRNLHVRDVERVNGKPETKNIRVDILIDGVTDDLPWTCGFEFDYANEESLYCRPLRLSEEKNPTRMPIPDLVREVRVAFLPPMSGLAANETRLDQGAVNVRLGEGRTAEVLRNLCHQVASQTDHRDRWSQVCARIKHLFGVALDAPRYLAERGEIAMTYQTRDGVRLDLSAAGRGSQQTLLLLAHLEVHPQSVLLLDEPDAHLEILRQRQIYDLLTTAAAEQSCQIIIASHSEVILNEAADRDVVVAFVGRPHRIDDRGRQVLKSLKEIGFEQYYQAEQKGWVLYLEGSTDLAILRAFAAALNHPAQAVLERPFVHYIQNQPIKARDHFRGLREAKNDLVGFTLCDRCPYPLQPTPELREYMWRRRELENYLCQPETLRAFAEADAHGDAPGPLFAGPESKRRRDVMNECIVDNIPPAALRDPEHPWWRDTKASEDFLDPVFRTYLTRLGLPLSLMQKSNYHILAKFVSPEHLSPEIHEVLDAIVEQSQKATPVGQEP